MGNYHVRFRGRGRDRSHRDVSPLPDGFYAPAQLVRDARDHGIEVRPVCINSSRWDSTLEGEDDERGCFAVQLGMSLVKGLANAHAAALVAARLRRPFASIDDLWRRAGVPQEALVRLAEADAFRPALGLARRESLWAIKGLHDEPLPLFAAAAQARETDEPAMALAPMIDGAEVVGDYNHLGLSLRAHPVSFLAGRPAATPDRALRHGHGAARWQTGRSGRTGAGAPAARVGRGGVLHHAVGRDWRRQSGDLARHLREVPIDHPLGQHGGRQGAHSARG